MKPTSFIRGTIIAVMLLVSMKWGERHGAAHIETHHADSSLDELAESAVESGAHAGYLMAVSGEVKIYGTNDIEDADRVGVAAREDYRKYHKDREDARRESREATQGK